MADQLGRSPTRASVPGIAIRIFFALALVLLMLFAIPAVVELLTTIWEHSAIVPIGVVAAVALVVLVTRLAK